MRDLRTWVVKRIPWRDGWGQRVIVADEFYVPARIAEALFAERQRLVRKLLKERARRKEAERRLTREGR